MEAEAQCAFLQTAGLVEGCVTEDNDVMLFGARTVYRNIFEGKVCRVDFLDLKYS